MRTLFVICICAAAMHGCVGVTLDVVRGIGDSVVDAAADAMIPDPNHDRTYIDAREHIVVCEFKETILPWGAYSNLAECSGSLERHGYLRIELAGVTGLQFGNGDGSSFPVVRYVHAGSPADGAGVRSADRIISIDGDTTRCAEDARDLMFGRVNTPVVVLVRRSGADTFFLLQREPYLKVYGAPKYEPETFHE